ncbi:MAG: hypothetical protein GY679_00960 [Mycoplasma sp.]|nr:hypothetical protein [Mycoplasma sp.]
MGKRLGKLASVKFGIGGYQDDMLGLHVTIDMKGSYVQTKSAWDCNKITWSERCKWTEDDRSKQYDEIMRYVSDLLHTAKVDTVDQLKGIPIEATFEGMILKEWRILDEVL